MALGMASRPPILERSREHWRRPSLLKCRWERAQGRVYLAQLPWCRGGDVKIAQQLNCFLFRGTSLAPKPQEFSSLPAYFLSLTLAPGHLRWCCRDRRRCTRPLPTSAAPAAPSLRVPGLPDLQEPMAEAPADSWSS